MEATATRVRELAVAKRFNATTLGEAVGVPSSSAANYWSGKRPWPSEALPRLADALETTVDALLGRDRSGVADQLRSWVAAPPDDELTPAELEWVQNFRRLDAPNREALQQIVRSAAGKGKPGK